MSGTSAFSAACAGVPTASWRGVAAAANRPHVQPGRDRQRRRARWHKKLASPAIPAEKLGAVEAKFLSHDQHVDNLDRAGRAYLEEAAGQAYIVPSASWMNLAPGERWDGRRLHRRAHQDRFCAKSGVPVLPRYERSKGIERLLLCSER